MKQNIIFKCFIILFLVASSLANAQKQLVLVSQNTKKPIAFATIKTAKTVGFYTNELGQFTLQDSIKSITINCLGFEQQTLSANTLQDTIKMQEKPIPIPEIVVREAAEKSLEIPLKKRNRSFGSLLLNSRQELILVASPYKAAAGRKINRINGLIKKHLFMKHAKKVRVKKQLLDSKTVIRLNIYTVKDGFFADKIYSSKALKIATFYGESFSIDLSKENIYFAKEGLAFAIEYIGNVSPNKKISYKDQHIRPATVSKQNKYYKAKTYLKYTFKNLEHIVPINDLINSNLPEGVKPNFDINLNFGFVLD